MAVDDEARRDNRARLRTLANDPRAGVRVFCAHDPRDLDQLQLAPTG
jgi:hypothetical protein